MDIKLKMTGGAIVHGKFESRLIKSGRSSGPSTLFSAITTGSGGLGGSGCIDDLDDLDIGEEEDLKLNSTTTNRDSQSSSKVTPPYVPSPPPGNETVRHTKNTMTVRPLFSSFFTSVSVLWTDPAISNWSSLLFSS